MGTTVLKIIPELRNAIINGNFDFNQRATASVVVSNSSAFVADSWRIFSSALYSVTGALSTDVPTVAQSGFQSRYSMLLTNGTGSAPGSNDYVQVGYRFEGQDYAALHGKRCRYQFWTKSSIAGTYPVVFITGGAARSYVSTYTINAANTWEMKTVDIQMETVTSGYNFDNKIGLYIYFSPTAGSSLSASTLNSWQTGTNQSYTGQTQWAATTGATMQFAQQAMYPVTAGAGVTLPFVRAGRNIQQELAACQRYFYSPDWEQLAGAGGYLASGYANGTVGGLVFIPLPVNMRVVPTLVQVGTFSVLQASASSGGNVTLSLNSTGAQVAVCGFNGASGLVAGNATALYKVTNTSALQFSAEL